MPKHGRFQFHHTIHSHSPYQSSRQHTTICIFNSLSLLQALHPKFLQPVNIVFQSPPLAFQILALVFQLLYIRPRRRQHISLRKQSTSTIRSELFGECFSQDVKSVIQCISIFLFDHVVCLSRVWGLGKSGGWRGRRDRGGWFMMRTIRNRRSARLGDLSGRGLNLGGWLEVCFC
jgi:hypothetical protein